MNNLNNIEIESDVESVDNIPEEDVVLIEDRPVRRRYHFHHIRSSDGLSIIPPGQFDCGMYIISNHLWLTYEHVRSNPIVGPMSTVAFRNEFPRFFEPIENYYNGNIPNTTLREMISNLWHDQQLFSLNYHDRNLMSLDQFLDVLIPEDNNGYFYRFIFRRQWICLPCQHVYTPDIPEPNIMRTQIFFNKSTRI
jgi:hypothetical protein